MEGVICNSCGNKKLREVNDEDFCYFVSIDEYYQEMFEEALKEYEIDAVCVPYYPSGSVSFGNVGRARGRHIYIRYKNLDKAAEIYDDLFFAEDSDEE